MISLLKKIVLIILFVNLSISFADEKEHDHEDHDKIQELSDKNHDHSKHDESQDNVNVFELGKKAITTFSLKTIEVVSYGKNKFKIPKSALLIFGEKKGVYKKVGNEFTLIEVLVHKKIKNSFLINSHELKKNDQIVHKGVPLLRVAHLEASGEIGEGQGH